MKDIIFQALANAAQQGENVVLGIITGVKGSSPQKIGAKALFYADGRIKGTLGGGCLEAEIQQRALSALRNGQPSTFELLLDHDFGWDDGLICGGKVSGVILPNAQRSGEIFWNQLAERKTILQWGVKENFSIGKMADINSPACYLYLETVSPACALWIAGAGHISQALAPLALLVGFDVTVWDDRSSLANHQNFPKEIFLKTGDWKELCHAELRPVPTFGLVMTRGHRHDAAVLKEWIQKPFLFIGMIGSARKARIIFDHFTEEKLATPEQLGRVACPVGVDIKSQSVPEIAVSIVAQLIEKRAELVYSAQIPVPTI